MIWGDLYPGDLLIDTSGPGPNDGEIIFVILVSPTTRDYSAIELSYIDEVAGFVRRWRRPMMKVIDSQTWSVYRNQEKLV